MICIEYRSRISLPHDVVQNSKICFTCVHIDGCERATLTLLLAQNNRYMPSVFYEISAGQHLNAPYSTCGSFQHV